MSARVLVVDDDPVIQLLLRVNLEMESFSVEVAGDGEEALTRVPAFNPSIVLLDVVMPKLDGFAVLERLRSDTDTASLPVILLSARNQDGDEKAGLDAGANLYVTKPFDPPDLIEKMKTLLASQS